jgi:ElaB/YqjD/DUF883 family membrane-anchored ribosome-binding protein
MASTGNQGFGAQREPQKTNEGTYGGVGSVIKEKVENAASSVASTAEEAWDSTRQGVQRAASTVAGTAEDAWAEMTGLMRRYPFGTLCVGIGVGFLMSRLLEDRGTRDFRRMGSDLYDQVRDYASEVASKVRS